MLFCLLFMGLLISCTSKTTVRLKGIGLDSLSFPAYREALEGRLHEFGMTANIAYVSGQIVMEMPDDSMLITKVLEPRGLLSVRETYIVDELHLEELYRMTDLEGKLQNPQPGVGGNCIITVADEPDTMAVMDAIEMLRKRRSLTDLLPMWGKDASTLYHSQSADKDCFELYAVRGSAEAALTNQDIAEIEVDERWDGKPALTLQFTDEAAIVWSDMTKQNVHRTIAIEMDGRVLTAPMVQTQVTGGLAQICSEMNHDQALCLRAIIKHPLPRPLLLVNKK